MIEAPPAGVAAATAVEVELLLVVIPQLFFASLAPAEATIAKSANFKSAFIIAYFV
jgi:hypothetical protein